ncbi:hypothetical protein GCM10010430_79080 [Kitasatospora cystarginea]|uniref:Uncharacterized protein n=1 Tax=Kitasatospora cystarginea TaxID=58350 RepID=A0ABP5RYD4_9ACTN
MDDPEQQDSEEDEVWDGDEGEDEAAATSGGWPFTDSLLRDYDPLGPLRAQLADVNRMLNQPVIDAMSAITARNNSLIAATMDAAVKPHIIDSSQIAAITGPPVWSKGVLDVVGANAAWQRPIVDSMLAASAAVKPLTFLSPEQIAAITGPPVWSQGVLDAVAAVQQNSVLEGVRAASAAFQPQLSILDSVLPVESSWVSSYLPPLNALALQATSFQSSLQQIADSIGRVFTEDLFAKFDTFSGLFKEWSPDNLRDVEARLWMWLLRITAKDGACLAWAPRAGIVKELLSLPRAAYRRRYLIEHRLEVVEDVEASLEEVDHPDLLDLRALTLQAAACIRDGHDAPAQALLANVLDTVMRAHGHAWLRSYFPQDAFPSSPNTGSHKMIAGALSTYREASQLRMLAAYLLVNAMKNVFSGVDRQHTFNRHLGSHRASADSYRSEFAFAALLNTQALLRLVDRHLYVWAFAPWPEQRFIRRGRRAGQTPRDPPTWHAPPPTRMRPAASSPSPSQACSPSPS